MRGAWKYSIGIFLIGVLSVGSSTLFLKPSLTLYQDAFEERDRLKNREDILIERLSGAVHPGQAPTFPSALLWRDRNDDTVDRNLQRVVVELAEQNAIKLSSFGVTKARVDTATPTIAFEIEGDASHEALVGFMGALTENQPPLAINSLVIRYVSSPNLIQDPTLSVRMTIWGFVQTDLVAQ